MVSSLQHLSRYKTSHEVTTKRIYISIKNLSGTADDMLIRLLCLSRHSSIYSFCAVPFLLLIRSKKKTVRDKERKGAGERDRQRYKGKGRENSVEGGQSEKEIK